MSDSQEPERVRYDSNERSVEDLLNLYEKEKLNLEPGFQRSSVWSRSDRSLLIDSILKNYPLPSIFLYKRQENGQLIFDVIDGKQRLETVLMFTGQIRGRRFHARVQLPGRSSSEFLDWNQIKRMERQYMLLGYKLQTLEVEGDLTEIINLFVRINSTGKALSTAEKHHAKYFHSAFLKAANRIAVKFRRYLESAGIVSSAQVSRMKHVELACELLVSAYQKDVIHKKEALDKAMAADSLRGRELAAIEKEVVRGLARVRRLFPKLTETRFAKISDFYSLAVLIQKFEREGYVLTDRRRNKIAARLLADFGAGVDQVSQSFKKLETQPLKPGQELYREYLQTVREGTDKIENRRKREKILRELLGSVFARKDKDRCFTEVQRRIIWHSSEKLECRGCGKALSWNNFTVDHVLPHSRGGKTRLDNAQLLCGPCNSRKGMRRRRAQA